MDVIFYACTYERGTLSVSLSPCSMQEDSWALSLSHTHTHAYTHTHAHPLLHSLCLSLAYTYTCAHIHTHTLSLSLSLIHIRTYTHTQTRTHTHTHRHLLLCMMHRIVDRTLLLFCGDRGHFCKDTGVCWKCRALLWRSRALRRWCRASLNLDYKQLRCTWTQQARQQIPVHAFYAQKPVTVEKSVYVDREVEVEKIVYVDQVRIPVCYTENHQVPHIVRLLPQSYLLRD